MNNSVAIITGAASGIGLEAARRLKQQGIKVFAVDTESIDLLSFAHFVNNYSPSARYT